MNFTEHRTINGKKVKFVIMLWKCKCGDSGIVRAPAAASSETPFKMADEDHAYLNPDCEQFDGSIGIRR